MQDGRIHAECSCLCDWRFARRELRLALRGICCVYPPQSTRNICVLSVCFVALSVSQSTVKLHCSAHSRNLCKAACTLGLGGGECCALSSHQWVPLCSCSADIWLYTRSRDAENGSAIAEQTGETLEQGFSSRHSNGSKAICTRQKTWYKIFSHPAGDIQGKAVTWQGTQHRHSHAGMPRHVMKPPSTFIWCPPLANVPSGDHLSI